MRRHGLHAGFFSSTLYSHGVEQMKAGKKAADAGDVEAAKKHYWGARDAFTQSKEPRATALREQCHQIFEGLVVGSEPKTLRSGELAKRHPEPDTLAEDAGEAARALDETFNRKGTGT